MRCKRRVSLGMALLSFLVWLWYGWLQPAVFRETLPSQAFPAPVVQVLDGDTLRIPGETVRLYGVDAPEKGQPFGAQATRCLIEMVAGRVVTVHPKGEDRYGRLLAVITVDGVDVNARLVAQGCAWAYPKTGEPYRDEEAQARQQRRGLWALPHPIPPWEWRK